MLQRAQRGRVEERQGLQSLSAERGIPTTTTLLAGVGFIGVGVWARAVGDEPWWLATTCVLGWTLLVLAWIDWHSFRLPDFLTLPLMLAGLGLAWMQGPDDLVACAIGAIAGYLALAAVDRVYYLAFGLGLVNLGVTLYLAFGPYSSFSRSERIILLGAAGTVLLCMVASLYNSWTFDYQAQGRYLFGAVGALALLVWGQQEREPGWARLTRSTSGALLVAMSVFVLVRYILLNPNMLQ